MTKLQIALVIGGTGMLAGLTKKLTEKYDTVGVVGRTASKMHELQAFSRKIVDHVVDYLDVASFTDELVHFTGVHGKPQLVVSWIHSTSPEASLVLADYCACDFYDVTGHDGIRQDHESRQREKTFKAKGIRYHRVILGRKGDRWLTNQEISDGVYQAIKAGQDEFVVGEL